MFAKGEQRKQRWIEIRTEVSEALPGTHLAKILPGARVFRNIYYPWRSGADSKQVWCEADLLVEYDGHLFIVEVKAGAFTYTPPATDFPASLLSG